MGKGLILTKEKDMEIKGKVHCFFEQSGTFKNEFIKLGIPAEDYDIQDNFGQTDHVIDLFKEIEDAYDGEPSLFDSIRGGQDGDLIMAFFPCIYFCENNELYFTGKHMNLSRLSKKEKIETILQRSRDRQSMYELCLKLFCVCDVRNIRLIVENPYAQAHYLVNNFPYKAVLIDKNRYLHGDFYKKPTQYWFLNCEPTNGYTFQRDKQCRRIDHAKSGKKAGLCSEDRSLISHDYARNFICDFVLGKEQKNSLLSLF